MALYKNYVGGVWMAGEESILNVNPSDTSDLIGEYACASRAQAREAVAAAGEAFSAWSGSGVQTRTDFLDHVGSELLARREELGTLLSREEGKTRREGVAEVTRAGHIFRFFAGEALRLSGELLPSVRPSVTVEVTREPLGVVAVITPWNYPVAIPAWKIAPALAWGNTVVFKPAGLVPASAWALTDIVVRAGLPAGVFNLVMGPGRTVGEALVTSPEVAGVTFTGSVETGEALLQKAAVRRAKVQLELGGKNPLVVLDDADLETAVRCAVDGAFFSAGQRCTASSRLIVTGGVHDAFVGALVDRLRTLKVGHALAPESDIGPVVDERQLAGNLAYIRLGQEEGGTLRWGGEPLRREHSGFYLAPALFTETDNAMRINQEEIFGPVATVIRVKDYEEALAVANDTPLGLSAGIITTSLKYAAHFKRHAQAGMVMVNLPTAGVDYHVPFGGRKGSSYGPREQGSYAKEFFTTVKTAYVGL